MKVGTNFTVFILFFGLALLEAFAARNWFRAALWVSVGALFLWADNTKKIKKGTQ